MRDGWSKTLPNGGVGFRAVKGGFRGGAVDSYVDRFRSAKRYERLANQVSVLVGFRSEWCVTMWEVY